MYHEHNYSISWMIYVIMAILLVIIQIVQLPTLFQYRCLFDVWIYDFTFIETNI